MGDQRTNGGARFKDQVALVVGGAQGIGKAIGVRLGREGAHIAIADIDCPMMEATAQEMRAESRDSRCLPCDVRDSAQVHLCGCVPFETIERAIVETGVEHTILSTDLGQPETPPAEGLRLYAERLRSTGFSVDQIRSMMQANPERLLAHSKAICPKS
jgi:NAD(P)-dependent dehydrogenase (short-subunit alcohol dehydrogenase family)